MGTCYYLCRPDNKTVFDMDKAYGFWDLLGREHRPLSQADFDAAMSLWITDNPEYVARVCAWVEQWADGHPFYFVSEHHEWIDGDEYRTNSWLRVWGDRFDGPNMRRPPWEPDWGAS